MIEAVKEAGGEEVDAHPYIEQFHKKWIRSLPKLQKVAKENTWEKYGFDEDTNELVESIKDVIAQRTDLTSSTMQTDQANVPEETKDASPKQVKKNQ